MQKRFKKTTRQLLTLVPFLLFIVASIVVLVLAQGKTIGNQGKLIESSLLRVNAYPANPDVFINGTKVSLGDSKTTNISPGKNTIKISKEGYYDWQKEIINYAGIIKDIYVQLYPEDIFFEKLTPKALEISTFSYDKQYIYFVRKTSINIELHRIKVTKGLFEFNNDVSEELIISIPNKQFSESEFSIVGLNINSNNSYVVLTLNSNEETSFKLINLESKKHSDLETSVGLTINSFEFLENSQSLLFKGENIIGEYNYSKEIKYLISNNIDSDLFIIGNNIIFVQNNLVYEYSEGIAREITGLNKALGSATLSTLQLLSVSTDKNIYIYKTNNNLVWFDLENNYKTLLDSNMLPYKFSENNKFVIFKKEEKFMTFTFEKNILDSKSYNVLVNEIDLSKYSLVDIQIVNGDKNLIAYTENKSILIMDFDGKNIREILPDFSFSQNEILIVNNSQMYGLVRDIINNESSELGNYIYKFDLERIAR